MRGRLVAVVAAVLVAAPGVATAAPGVAAVPVRDGSGVVGAQTARVVDCHRWASYPNVLISSARNMTCRAAARDMRHTKKGISRHFRTAGGFRCSRVSGGALGGQWRCVRGHRAYRFEFGD